MKKYAAIIYRKLISPSMRVKLRETAAWLREQFGRACLWRWEITRLSNRKDSSYDIVFVGRKTHRELAKMLLAGNDEIGASQVRASLLSRTAFVSEMQIPGALRVPCYLISIVALGKPLAEITAKYDKTLQKLIRNHRQGYYKQHAVDDADIDRADREMIQPYARARHGTAAAQIGSDNVRRMAQSYGRLDLLYFEGEVVGCSLGYPLSRAGKRYWVGVRVGYPEKVFSSSNRLREINAINNYITVEWAHDNDFDYYDNGMSLGKPDDGLLQWKKSRGAVLETRGYHSYFYVRLPRVAAVQFLWNSPLFAVEHHKLTLHLGLPHGAGDDEVMTRYRQMGFGGLFKIYLHCTRPPGEQLLEKLNSLYTHQESPPIVDIIPCT